MVYNSNGKTYLNQFTYNNVDLETVANYCYLGMVLKFNGNFNLAINTLMEKARKAYFKIKKTIGFNNPCRLLEKLFDSLVTPTTKSRDSEQTSFCARYSEKSLKILKITKILNRF